MFDDDDEQDPGFEPEHTPSLPLSFQNLAGLGPSGRIPHSPHSHPTPAPRSVWAHRPPLPPSMGGKAVREASTTLPRDSATREYAEAFALFDQVPPPGDRSTGNGWGEGEPGQAQGRWWGSSPPQPHRPHPSPIPCGPGWRWVRGGGGVEPRGVCSSSRARGSRQTSGDGSGCQRERGERRGNAPPEGPPPRRTGTGRSARRSWGSWCGASGSTPRRPS